MQLSGRFMDIKGRIIVEQTEGTNSVSIKMSHVVEGRLWVLFYYSSLPRTKSVWRHPQTLCRLHILNPSLLFWYQSKYTHEIPFNQSMLHIHLIELKGMTKSLHYELKSRTHTWMLWFCCAYTDTFLTNYTNIILVHHRRIKLNI